MPQPDALVTVILKSFLSGTGYPVVSSTPEEEK